MSLLAVLSQLLATLVLLTALAILATRFFNTQLSAFTYQSWALAAYAGLVAWLGGHPGLYLAAGITLAFRGVLVPLILRRFALALPAKREEHLTIGTPASILLGVVLSALAVAIALRLAHHGGYLLVAPLSTGLAVVLMGFLLTASRPEAFPQILGLLLIENGSFLVGLGLAPDLPLFTELVALFDLLMLVIIVGFLLRVLVERTRTSSTHELTELRG